MTRIFDFHTHAYPEKVAGKAVEFLNRYYHVRCRGDGTMADLLASARDAGVTGLLVHAVATRPDQVENVNSWIAAHVSDRLVGFGTIHPQYENIEREIDRIAALGLRGIKLHPDFQEYYVNDASMDRVYRAAQGRLPVLFHAGDENSEYSAPARIADVVRRFPDLTVIAAHFGGYSQWREAERHLIGRDLYIDTSSTLWALSPEKAVSLIRAHGADKVLFGTDYPLTRHRDELARFFALPLTPEEQRSILYGNAQRLLGLPD